MINQNPLLNVFEIFSLFISDRSTFYDMYNATGTLLLCTIAQGFRFLLRCQGLLLVGSQEKPENWVKQRKCYQTEREVDLLLVLFVLLLAEVARAIILGTAWGLLDS